MSIAQFLKNYRTLHNIKSKDMGDNLQMDAGTYSRLESGVIKKAKSKTIQRIAEYLNLTEYELTRDIINSIDPDDEKYGYFFHYLKTKHPNVSYRTPFHFPTKSPKMFFNVGIVYADHKVDAYQSFDSYIEVIENDDQFAALARHLLSGKSKIEILTGRLFDEWNHWYRYINYDNLNSINIIFNANEQEHVDAYNRLIEREYYFMPFPINLILYDMNNMNQSPTSVNICKEASHDDFL